MSCLSCLVSPVCRALCVALGVLALGASMSPVAVTSLSTAEIAEWVETPVALVVSQVRILPAEGELPPAPSPVQLPVPLHPEAPPTPPPEA